MQAPQMSSIDISFKPVTAILALVIRGPRLPAKLQALDTYSHSTIATLLL